MAVTVADLVLRFVYDDETGDKQFYMPGDVLRGEIQLHLIRALRVRALTLLILGGASVSWEEPDRKKEFTAREEYLQGIKMLLQAGPEDSVELSRGAHRFSFQYQLPSFLPSTFSGIYGSVTYLAKVILSTEDEHSTTVTSEPFMVLRRPPLPPRTLADTEQKASKMYFGFFNAGKIKLNCRINRSAAIPGEILYVNAEVNNTSAKSIVQIQGAVILESTYHAQSAKDKKILFRQIINKRIDVFDVNNRWGRRWRNVQMAIPPYLPDSGLEGCKIIDLRYFFEYRAQIYDSDDVFVQIPLYVGGLPETPKVMGGQGYYDALGEGLGQGQAPRYLDLRDERSLFQRDLPWYGGGSAAGALTESVDGDLQQIR